MARKCRRCNEDTHEGGGVCTNRACPLNKAAVLVGVPALAPTREFRLRLCRKCQQETYTGSRFCANPFCPTNQRPDPDEDGPVYLSVASVIEKHSNDGIELATYLTNLQEIVVRSYNEIGAVPLQDLFLRLDAEFYAIDPNAPPEGGTPLLFLQNVKCILGRFFSNTCNEGAMGRGGGLDRWSGGVQR